MPLLAVNELRVEIDGAVLVDRWSLAVAAGERVALRGPSGSGKTTVLRTLARLREPAAGSVLLDGRDAADWGWPSYRRRVCYLPQRAQMTAGTVAENLARPFRYASASGALDEARARELLAAMRLPGAVWSAEAARLSVGEQQRVAIVRLLLVEPRVMLLDEPTSSLDEAAEGAAEELIAAQQERTGAAIVIVTHASEQAARFCHREVHLGGGAGRAADDVREAQPGRGGDP